MRQKAVPYSILTTIFALCGVAAFMATSRSEGEGKPASGGKLVFPAGKTVPEGYQPKKDPEKPAPQSASGFQTSAVASNLEQLPEEVALAMGRFFGLLELNNIDGAYQALLRGTKIAENPSDVELLKDKTRAALELFGKMRGYELIGVQYVGSSLLRAEGLSLGSTLPLRWKFYFYRSGVEELSWRLVDVRVDDNLVGMFDPGGKETIAASRAD